MSKYFKQFLQIMFLGLFLVLVITGKMQVWMIIFLCSFFAALLFGRFYCGWICPINTTIEWIGRIYKHFGLNRRAVPLWMKKPFIRYSMLLLFLFAFIFVFSTGKKLPVLPVLFIAGMVLSLFFVPQLWHRYLCPYGTLLNITGSSARKSYRIYGEECLKCGICKKVCPGDAVEMESNDVLPEIKQGHCLVCSSCADACPKKIIRYK